MTLLRTQKTLLVLVVLYLSACAPSEPSLQEKAQALAESAGMQEAQITTPQFSILAYERIQSATAPVHVYIEGDGDNWDTGNRPTDDPTPLEPIALQLAVRDSAPNVAWLARPCQYIMEGACAPKYWTNAQYGEEVIRSYTEALSRWSNHRLELIGYSGGAAVALLSAARRTDVDSIRTVAGNIDTAIFSSIHRVPPLAGSTNPALYARHLTNIPQLHFVGESDRVTPRAIAESYQSRLPATNCSAYTVVGGMDHYEGWQAQWPMLLGWKLPCTN